MSIKFDNNIMYYLLRKQKMVQCFYLNISLL
jgi:hypothetical protein